MLQADEPHRLLETECGELDAVGAISKKAWSAWTSAQPPRPTFCGAPFQPVELLGAGKVSVPPALTSATSTLAPLGALVLLVSVPLAWAPKTIREELEPGLAGPGGRTA